jgi:hypothetical protein
VETSRIKVKIGDNEFEAEGPTEVVKEQFEAFKEIIRLNPAKTQNNPMSDSVQTIVNQFVADGIPMLSLDKIVHVSGRIVSLTALPTTVEDAALLIMLGHKELKQNISVTGQEIGDGLAQSGRPVPRVDRIMESAITEALVLKTGVKRATRYRLTNQGLVKAQRLASDLLANLP